MSIRKYQHFTEIKKNVCVFYLQVNMILFIPYCAIEFLDARPNRPVNTSSLKGIFLIGCMVQKKLMEGLSATFPNILIDQSYGQTESSGLIIGWNLSRKEDLERMKVKLTSCGRMKPEFDWKVSVKIFCTVVIQFVLFVWP